MKYTVISIAVLLASSGCGRILGLGDPTLADDAGGVDARTDAHAAVDAGPRCDDGFESVTRRFVIDSMEMPFNATSAARLGLDIDGDAQARPDNAIGQIFSVLLGQAGDEIELQPHIDEVLASGALLQLIKVSEGDVCANTELFAGVDRDQPPNPSDNFSGTEPFDIDRRVGVMPGMMDGRDVAPGPPGQAELRIPLLDGAPPVELPLSAARVSYTIDNEGLVEGVIGGAIPEDIIEGVVLPNWLDAMSTPIERDCNGTAPECCPLDSDGQLWLDLFDDDLDCQITIQELRESALLSSLFAPDLDLFDSTDGNVFAPNVDGLEDSVSIGIGFTATTASFLDLP